MMFVERLKLGKFWNINDSFFPKVFFPLKLKSRIKKTLNLILGY